MKIIIKGPQIAKFCAYNLIHLCCECVIKTKAQGGICALCKWGQKFVRFDILTKFPQISFPDETAVTWNGKKPSKNIPIHHTHSLFLVICL